jgi:hypothetical protein
VKLKKNRLTNLAGTPRRNASPTQASRGWKAGGPGTPGRLPRGLAFEGWLNEDVSKGGPANLHAEQPPPGAPRARGGGGHGLQAKIDTR